jgi:geranylgeranyl reductase family protein
MIQTDVCVLGAGPGGVAASLQLAKLGISSILVDKAVFPRDKICGDALSGKVVYAFNRIDKAIFQDFHAQKDIKADCWGVKFVYPNDIEIEIKMGKDLTEEELPFHKPDGFISKRIDFDNFLVNYVRKEDLIDFREDTHITDIKRTDNGFILKDKKGTTEIHAKLVISADGAQSKFAREHGNIQKEDKHYAGSVRAYYKNVKGCTAHNHIELHYITEFFPGYLWIFPLPNGAANVGVGMRTDKLSKNKINLKKELIRLLDEHPRFKDRFNEAEIDGKMKGFGLPLGSKKRKISGDNYMLIGDAASLIDPLTGEGIGNASISGRFAALQAKECLDANDFSAAFLKKYDKTVYNKLWKELQISTQLQRSFQYPRVVNFTAKLVHKNKRFIEILSSMFVDVDLRKKLRNPMFYVRMLFNR